jgi:hypothetical protein
MQRAAVRLWLSPWPNGQMLQSPYWSRYGARRAFIAALRTVQILRGRSTCQVISEDSFRQIRHIARSECAIKPIVPNARGSLHCVTKTKRALIPHTRGSLCDGVARPTAKDHGSAEARSGLVMEMPGVHPGVISNDSGKNDWL